MGSPLKSGFLQRYSRKFMQEGWKNIWCVLYNDSTFAWYKHQSDRTPKGQVNMKTIASFFAVGSYATRVPNAPRVSQNQANLLLALPDRPSRDAFVEFFMANNPQELNEWMGKIVSCLPPPPQQQPPAGGPPAPYSSSQYPHASSSAPYPAAEPGGSAPPIGFAAMPQPGGGPGPAPYPPQQGPYPANPAYPPQQGPPPYQGYHQQGYPPQQGYPAQQGYPQQGGAYPQQQGYPAAAAGAAGYATGHPTHEVVYVNGKPKKKKKKILGVNQNTAMGLAGGAAAGYMLGKMTGGWGGGWGHGLGGGWGSWSSLSSFGSCGSFGSFGSFG